MAGISSKALNGVSENKYKFNDGTELNTSFDIGLYETDFRMYDPQIGRFVQSDELAEAFNEWSPYVFATNNPILLNDPTGLAPDCPDCPTGQLAEEKVLSEVVLSSNPRPKAITIINTPGITFRKNPNYNPWDEDQYKRQPYINFQVWNPTNNIKGSDAEMLREWAEFALWLVPASKLVKGAKWLFALKKIKQIIGIARLAHASRLGIKSYKVLKALNDVVKTQVHHLFEKRFANLLGQKADNMLSIVVTETEHQVFTNAWRAEIGYNGSNAVITTATATAQQVENAARKIYKEYPDILKALGL